MEQGGSGYFLECEVLPPVEDRRLHLVDDAPSFSLTTYLAYFTEADETEAVKTALDGLEAIHHFSEVSALSNI